MSAPFGRSAAACFRARRGRAERSEGVWRAAWRRFKTDRVGLVSLVIVIAFLLLIAGRLPRAWWPASGSAEVGVPNAPPTFLGPRRPEAIGTIEVPKGPNVDLSAVDPLAPRYKEWDERAAKYKTVETAQGRDPALGGDRLGRDVLAKAIKGTEISVFVGVLAALAGHLIGTVLGALAASSAARSATSSSGCTTSSSRSPTSC
jgi:oligopeptide transport system permease protein